MRRENARIVSHALLMGWYCCFILRRVMGLEVAEDIWDYAANLKGSQLIT